MTEPQANPTPKARGLERRMTFMGKSTYYTQNETNPSYPMGVTYMDGEIKYDDFLKLFQERIMDDPGFIRMHCRVNAEEGTFQKVDVKLEKQIIEYPISELVERIPDDEGPEDLTDADRRLIGYIDQIMTTHLDDSRPLWQVTLIQGYPGGTVMITKMHHCMADGTSFGLLFAKMCDVAPGARPLNAGSKPEKPHTKKRNAVEKILLQVWGLLLYLLYWIVGVISFHIKYGTNYMRREQPTVLKNKLTGSRRLAYTHPKNVTDIKATGRAFGATINDVALAAIAGSLRRHLLELGTKPQLLDHPIRSAVPVNIREPADYKASEALRNLFGFIVVRSPVHCRDPVKRLKAITAEMRSIKRTPEGKLSSFLSLSLSNVPQTFLAKTLDFNSNYFSFVCTNVAGPQESLSIGGVSVKYGLGVVPPPNNIGLGYAIWSYYGDLRVTISADTGIEVDPWRLAELFEEELQALENAAKEKSERAKKTD